MSATTEAVRKWLQYKHDVVADLAPALIGEIGVRTAYSAFAMLAAAPTAVYVGIDVGDSQKYGSEDGALDHGLKVLETFPYTMVRVIDSHDIDILPPFDLLHIDGDHSYEGCMADLNLAKYSCVKWVLVDDYDWNNVPVAVNDFARKNVLDVEHIKDGFRGSALMKIC